MTDKGHIAAFNMRGTLDGFHIAAFNLEGTLEGLRRCDPGELSEAWLRSANQLLGLGGEMFDYSWPDALSRIRTKFTSVRGSALATFLVSDQIAASIFLSRGEESTAEGQVMSIFAEALANSDPAREGGVAGAFEQIKEIEERPLMVVVPWLSEGVEQRDHDLVRELAIHLAAAYFRKPPAAG